MHGWLVVATLGLAFGCLEGEDGRAAGVSPESRQEGLRKADEVLNQGRKPGLAGVFLLVGLPGASLAGTLGASRQAAGAGELVVGLGALLFCAGLSLYTLRLARIVICGRCWTWLPFIVYLTAMIAGLAGGPSQP